jgi:hypothetical protein
LLYRNSQTQTVPAVQADMNDSRNISAVTDNIRNVNFVRITPTATFPGNGIITVTGTYQCPVLAAGVEALIVYASQN